MVELSHVGGKIFLLVDNFKGTVVQLIFVAPSLVKGAVEGKQRADSG